MVQSSSGPTNDLLAALFAGDPSKPAARDNDLAALLSNSTPKPTSPALDLLSLAEALGTKPKPSKLLGSLFTVGTSSPGTIPDPRPPGLPGGFPGVNFLNSVLAPSPPVAYAPTRRRTFFSFHYADVIRVNNVRKSQEFRDSKSGPEITFYDGSLWESVKLEGDESLKRLIREGIRNTSVVCVLIGTETWARPWVRYEIARSVIDRKGLLAVDINGLHHHRDQVPHPRGPNPLAYMAVGKMRDGTYRLFEKRFAFLHGAWHWGWYLYDKHLAAVDLPRYLPDPAVDCVTPLGRGTLRYDFALHQGHKNIGGWIDLAAINAGR